jgi:hypothetical protein
LVININEENFDLKIKTTDDFTLKLLDIYMVYAQSKISSKISSKIEQTLPVVEQTPPLAEQIPQIVEQEKPRQSKTSGYSWTQAEDQILVDNIKKYSFREIFDKNLLPGRTRSAIENRVNRLGIRKTKYKKTITKETSGDIKNINFTGKVLTTHWVPVYEQCFNHLVFKLTDKSFFNRHNILRILKKWYLEVKGYDFSNKGSRAINDYIYSYLRYGKEHGFFEKIHFGRYRVIKKEEVETEKVAEKVAKTVVEKVVAPVVSNKPPVTDENKSRITIVGIDDGSSPPVKGFTQHMQNRIREIDERRRLYEKSIAKEETTTEADK